MTYEGIPALYDTVFMMFETAPTIQICSTKKDQCLHWTTPLPSRDVAQTIFHAEEYPRSDGSGRTDFFVILESVAGTTMKNIKKNPEFQEYLRSHNIHIFSHRHESFRVSTIGHLFNKLPEATNMDSLRDYLENEMAIIRGILPGDSVMNRIELSFNRVIHFAEDESGKTFRGDTLAIQVVCATAHAKLTRRLLESGIAANSQTGKFVPRSLSNLDPGEYLIVLADHEKFRQQHSFLRVHNLPPLVAEWEILDPNDGSPKTFSECIWKMKDEDLPITRSIDSAVHTPGDWLVVIPNHCVESVKQQILVLVDAVKQTDRFAAENAEGVEWNVHFSHRDDTKSQHQQYITGITRSIDRTTTRIAEIFQAVEKKQPRAPTKPTPALKPSLYTLSDPSKSGVTWAEMVKPGKHFVSAASLQNNNEQSVIQGNPNECISAVKGNRFWARRRHSTRSRCRYSQCILRRRNVL
jgi:hypothetical protein